MVFQVLNVLGDYTLDVVLCHNLLSLCVDLIHCQGKCDTVVICWRSGPSFTMIWCSGYSVLRAANTEFPTLHNHRFPQGKWRLTALNCIKFSCVLPLPLRASPFSSCPETTSPHRTRLPSLPPCSSSLALLSLPPPLCLYHPIFPCSAVNSLPSTSP